MVRKSEADPAAESLPDSPVEPEVIPAPETTEPVEPPAVDATLEVTAPAPQPAQRRALVFWPLALGGAVAAGLGGGASYGILKTYPALIAAPDLAGVGQTLSDHDKRLGDLSAALAAVPTGTAAVDPAPAIQAAIDPVAARLAAVDQALATLADRMTALESRPAAGPSTPADAAATAAAVKAAEAAAQELKDQAEALRHQAARAKALAGIEAGLESGAAIAPALDSLTAEGITVPEALAAVAQGAPTMAALREVFPQAARDAIAQSLATTPEATTWGRVGQFLRSQTGARSLSPKAGDDPDAVLSRAEAALKVNDLRTALAEIAALPQAGQDRMAEWTKLAGRRLAATDALAALSAEAQP